MTRGSRRFVAALAIAPVVIGLWFVVPLLTMAPLQLGTWLTLTIVAIAIVAISLVAARLWGPRMARNDTAGGRNRLACVGASLTSHGLSLLTALFLLLSAEQLDRATREGSSTVDDGAFTTWLILAFYVVPMSLLTVPLQTWIIGRVFRRIRLARVDGLADNADG